MNDPQKYTAKVEVTTTARLHMGFFDLNGQLGRRFGSLGLSLQALPTHIELALGEQAFVDQDQSSYVNNYKQALLAHLGIAEPVSIRVLQQMPRHSGLGSGTQMALAIGAGINQLFGCQLSFTDIASIVQRGRRSGIGIGTFAHGGLVLDGGVGAHTTIPPVIAQHPFPPKWRILLIFDRSHIGVHGAEEVQAFNSLADHTLSATQKVSHALLMQALPAILEQDLAQFGAAIAQLQAYNGDYFSPTQGGRYASKQVAPVLEHLANLGISCVGQSSWGPTGFAVFESERVAKQYLQGLQAKFSHPDLAWLICGANNTGASVVSKHHAS